MKASNDMWIDAPYVAWGFDLDGKYIEKECIRCKKICKFRSSKISKKSICYACRIKSNKSS